MLPMEEDIQNSAAMARQQYDSFNSRDFEKGATLVSPETEWTNVPLGRTFKGVDGYWEHLQSWASAFPDLTMEVIATYPGSDWIVSELLARGTHEGPLTTAVGEMPPTGHSIELPLCEVMLIRSGKIAAARLYFDASTLLRQLGIENISFAA